LSQPPSSNGEGSSLWTFSKPNDSTGYAIRQSTLESEPKVDNPRPQRKMLAVHRSQSRLILPKRVAAHPMVTLLTCVFHPQLS
jgi:hypothetical protein